MDTPTLESLLTKKLLPWQAQFVADERALIVLKMGRKSGKTFGCAFKIALDALNESFQHTDGILILSKGQRQASEIFATVKGMLQKTGILFKFLDSSRRPGEGYASRTKLILPNGNKIYCLPAGFTGDTLRTYSFWKIYYDEAAYIPDDVFISTDACLAVYGQQEVYASTPDLSSGKFYDVWHTEDAGRYELMTKQAGLVKPEFLYRKKKSMTLLDYQREYEGKFVEAAEGLFSRELLAACVSKENFNKPDLFSKGIVFLGIDFARFGKDDNAIAYCHWHETKAYVHVEVIHSKFRTTHITGKAMHLVKTHPNIKQIITDEGGVGAGATDALIEALGKRKVIGIGWHREARNANYENYEGRPRPRKTDFYSNLIRFMEAGKIQFDNDIKIVRSLRSMRYKYSAQGDLVIYGGDSHIAEAIVRAVSPLVFRRLKPLSIPYISSIPHTQAISQTVDIWNW